MLYDDIQQLEVRYVIALEYHDVDIYGGGDPIPEGEVWIKRNAIRLSRRKTRAGDRSTSLPFFLFCENLSEKEDFYFALLKNQEKSIADDNPIPQEFEVQDIIGLVQKLHSSEEQLQTRWLNALIGRLFLAMYKTPELEQFIRNKLTKKISRVKKPNFITRLALRKIDTGTAAPFITNPRLRDLTVNGDCTAEADVKYEGNFRIEIAATARIELGSRIKPREVDLVLAATCRKLEGHALLRLKPPPSNRIWFTFDKMPRLDLALEPIVSSRQITYNPILRAIESRIREVIAETICLPFWDDIPFLDTSNERYRGGIWKKEPLATASTDIPDEEIEDAAEAGVSGTSTPVEVSKEDRIMSMPSLSDPKSIGRNSVGKKSISSFNDLFGAKGLETTDKSEPQTPRLMRSPSFASAANPTITTNHADADVPAREMDASSKRESVASFLKDLSARSPTGSQAGSPPIDSAMAAALKERSNSNASVRSNRNLSQQIEHLDPANGQGDRTPTLSRKSSANSVDTTSLKDGRPNTAQEGSKSTKGFAQAAKSLTSGDRKQALASINAATAAAQKWGWGVLARNRRREALAGTGGGPEEGPPIPREPMGRGRPLPPPGMPLPPPPKPVKNSFVMPKRKAIPPPLLPKRTDSHESGEPSPVKSSSSRPVLPERRRRQNSKQQDNEPENDILVVEAPSESAPASPAVNEHHDEFFGHGETTVPETIPKPPLPVRRDESPPGYDDGKSEIDRQEIGAYTL
jgi:hypothetical protein